MIETIGSFDIRFHFPAKNISEDKNNMITFGSDISKFSTKKKFSVPDLSLAGGIGHRPVLTVPIMVVPLKI